ncbi:MAG: tRNA epoxyqueuosine(34) reductase QueG [Acidimicrobiales bacterium]
MRPLAAKLRQVGRAAGLDALGFTGAEPFSTTRQILEQRRDAGLSGGMQFTYRNPRRSTSPGQTLPGARALVVGARRYDRARPTPRDRFDRRPRGRVARYSWVDHYQPLRDSLESVAGVLRAEGWRARVLADDNALVDRAAAQRAGLGWYGKNTNILLPGLGSWCVIGSVLTDAPLPPDVPMEDGCGRCRRCLPACPTGALSAPGVLDARRCLAWLVQAPGVFPMEHRVALGDRLYGCDDCQEACPANGAERRRGADDRIDPDGGAPHGARAQRPPPAEIGAEPEVDLLELLAASDEEILTRWGRWYIPERNPRYLRRNAIVVLGNVAAPDDGGVQAALRRALADPDPLLRGHAVWATRRLGLDDLLVEVARDPDPVVRAELEASVASR